MQKNPATEMKGLISPVLTTGSEVFARLGTRFSAQLSFNSTHSPVRTCCMLRYRDQRAQRSAKRERAGRPDRGCHAPPCLVHFQSTVLRLPVVRRLVTDSQLPRQIGHRPPVNDEASDL